MSRYTKQRLQKVILEALDELAKDDERLKDVEKRTRAREKKRQEDRERRHRAMLKQGGLEEEDRRQEEFKVKYPCGSPNANPFHNEDGEWASEAEAASWAIGKKGSGCLSGQFKGDKHGQSSQEPCGRKDRTRKCKEVNEEDALEQKDTREALLYKFEKLQIEFRKLVAAYKELKKRKKIKKGFDLERCLKVVNTTVASTKGQLDAKKKKS